MSKLERKKPIQRSYRDSVHGTNLRPRLSVFRSNKEIYAQIINDDLGITIASSSSRDKQFEKFSGSKLDLSKEVGKLVAKKAMDAGIKKIGFDRNGYLYHGHIKSLAEGAREQGLNF